MNAGQTLSQAMQRHRAGDLRAAELLYRQVLQTVPRQIDALHLLGLIAHQVGRHDLAVDYIGQALHENPNYAEAHCNLGSVRLALGQVDEAAACFRRAAQIKPDYAEAHYNLGNILRQQDNLTEAAASYEQALRIKPDLVEALNSLGGVLKTQEKRAEAIATWERAIAVKPDHDGAHNNLATARLDEGNLAAAQAGFDRALLLRPDNVDYHFNRALLLLLQGQFTAGWDEYEWRWRRPEQPPRALTQPLWQGEPLAGRTILLHAEQGLGDTLHTVRYLDLVRARGAGQILLECQTPLVRLLTQSLGSGPDARLRADRILAKGEPLPSFDLHAPLFSLPRLLGTTSLQQIPCDIPYLHCDEKIVRHWQSRLDTLASERLLRIGIVWQGNPENKEDKRRSVPVTRFAPLREVPGVTLFSLQKGPGREQIADLPGLVDLGNELTDFADTAAILQNLDLVVSVDTAIAHLAGALGVPAWIALSYIPDWRWLMDRTDSPWYPTLRLFRQSRAGEWDEVFARIRNGLEDLATEGFGNKVTSTLP